jgi:hypothetical protein
MVALLACGWFGSVLAGGVVEPWRGDVPDRDPAALLAAFIQADAWGLQTSSEYWPLVKRFTVWEDGPGWDASSIIESARILDRKDSPGRVVFTLRYRKLAEMHADGEGKPVLDAVKPAWEDARFILEQQAGTGRWRIVEPQSHPHLSVGYALAVVLPDWCGPGLCRGSKAARLLGQWQATCAVSPIAINRTCGAGAK